jgi:hypothetical protein
MLAWLQRALRIDSCIADAGIDTDAHTDTWPLYPIYRRRV